MKLKNANKKSTSSKILQEVARDEVQSRQIILADEEVYDSERLHQLKETDNDW